MSTKIVDKGWNSYIRKTLACDDKFSKVGYPDGGSVGVAKGKPRTMAEVIDIAIVHEFGAPKANIPMRPHVRATFDEDKVALQKRVFKEIVLILDGKSTPEKSLARLGEWHAARIKSMIRSGDFKPLSEQTIKRKGSDKPLIDTAQMLQSVTHEEN